MCLFSSSFLFLVVLLFVFLFFNKNSESKVDGDLGRNRELLNLIWSTRMTFAKFLQLVRFKSFQSDIESGQTVLNEELSLLKSITDPMYLEASMFPPDQLRKPRFLVDTAVDLMGKRGVPADIPAGIKNSFVPPHFSEKDKEKKLTRLTRAIRRKVIKLQIPPLFSSIELSLFFSLFCFICFFFHSFLFLFFSNTQKMENLIWM